jgi:arylformamidase
MRRIFILTLLTAILLTSCRFARGPAPVPASTAESTSESPLPTASPAPQSVPSRPVYNVRYSDVPAANPDSVSLDIYPSGETNSPVMIYLHGGGWRGGTRSNVDSKPAAYNAHGFVFVSIDYRVIPEVTVTDEAGDAARAIRWMRDNITQYGGDPSRIFLMGHSAGAHLIALVGTNSQYLEAVGLSFADLRGVVAIDAQAYDVTALMEAIGRPAYGPYFDALGSDPAVWEQLSPITYVAPRKGIPPFFVAYSGAEAAHPEISRAFVAALEGAGIPTTMLPVTDKSHSQIIREFGRAGDVVSEAVFKWLEEILALGGLP